MANRLVIWAGVAASVVLVAGGAWYTLSRPAILSADASDPVLVRTGRVVYGAQCASCHGAKLEGEPNWRQLRPDGTLPSPPHDQTGHTWHHSDKVLFGITKHGGQRSAPPGFTSRMPAFRDRATDAEIYAVLAYIKSRWPERIRERQERINSQTR